MAGDEHGERADVEPSDAELAGGPTVSDDQANLLGGVPEQEIVENTKRKTLPMRIVSAIVMVAIAVGAYFYAGELGLDLMIAAVAALCFFEFLFLVIKATENVNYRLAAILAGAVYIGLAAVIMIGFELQPLYITLVTVIFADVFAFMFGSWIGGPRIMPKVSPNKTWAGLFGGMFGATLALMPLMAYSYIEQGFFNVQLFIALLIAGPILATLSLGGDLFESWLKRKAGVKDSSRLIPGHGGFFDRFDGVIPVAIVVGVFTAVAI